MGIRRIKVFSYDIGILSFLYSSLRCLAVERSPRLRRQLAVVILLLRQLEVGRQQLRRVLQVPLQQNGGGNGISVVANKKSSVLELQPLDSLVVEPSVYHICMIGVFVMQKR